jgi:PleD family two-component response regulator
VDKLAIPVTTSIGVATFEPGGPFRAAMQLMKAADLAVYNAKHSGRNCVKVFALKPAAPAAKTAAA